MPSPFPGMDPYLEAPQLWPDFHSRFIVYLAEIVRPLIRPRYVAAVQTRVFIEGINQDRIPDISLRSKAPGRSSVAAAAVLEADAPIEIEAPELEIEETFLQIIDLKTNQRVVTVIELVSPTNKYPGPGRDAYLVKQNEVRRSEAHLVEIDLLRTGPHVLAIPQRLAASVAPYDYLTCINRAAGTRSGYQLYPRRVRERLPRIRCPLAGDDDDVVLDLQAVLERTYDAGGYEDLIRYDLPCVPPLSPEDQAWAERLLQARQHS